MMSGDDSVTLNERKIKGTIIYKGLFVLSAVIGILLQCGIGTDHFSLSSFRMFTTLSNLAVAVFFVVDTAACLCDRLSLKSQKIIEYFRFLITMSILLTGLVAHFMLRGMFANMDILSKAGLALLHYVVPVGTVLDWILFEKKGKTEWKMPLFAAGFPIIYVAITMLAAKIIPMKNKYPYPFLDVDILGATGVLVNVVLLAAGFLLIGYIGVWIDHKLKFKR